MQVLGNLRDLPGNTHGNTNRFLRISIKLYAYCAVGTRFSVFELIFLDQKVEAFIELAKRLFVVRKKADFMCFQMNPIEFVIS